MVVTVLAIAAVTFLTPIGHAYPPAVAMRFLVTYVLVASFSYGLESSRRRFYLRLATEKAALEDALAQVKTLRGLLPICTGCKKVRDDEGYWQVIEEYVGSGVRYVILGSKAAAAPHFIADVCVEFPGHIIVGIDGRDGKVATDGWSKLSQHDVIDLAQHFERDGVEAVIFTDIGRDGMLSGVNVAATVELARAVSIPIIASGGITSLEDVKALCAVSEEGVMGAITGRAIYEGTLDFAAGQKLADELAAGAW